MEQIFGIINWPFAIIMRLFDGFTGNYAITLLLFTIVIKLVFVPLGIKQQKNQIKMAALRPKEQVIRNKYKGRTDRATQQKMQQELLELQQKENVSPFGGCLPLIVQLVVIMSVYSIIREPLEYICQLKPEELLAFATEFSWTNIKGDLITDLKGVASLDQIKAIAMSEGELIASGVDVPNLHLFGLNLGVVPKDVFNGFIGKTAVAGVGTEAATIWNVVAYMIIPALCFGLQVATMKITRKFTYQSSAAQDAQSGLSMKIMDWAMPLMSLYFCFTMSSAVGLYWIYSNILSFVQTVILSKAMPLPKITDEDIKKAEKEMKQKGYNTKKADLPRVRSLHHIDDEDYDSLPEIEAEAKGASNTLLNGEKVKSKSAGKNKITDEKPTIKD